MQKQENRKFNPMGLK